MRERTSTTNAQAAILFDPSVVSSIQFFVHLYNDFTASIEGTEPLKHTIPCETMASRAESNSS
ncbi:MAG: hypothetical protein MK171_06245 [Pirellulales bacterium]|nr:hypothetical protein [Pirellulales bacterium]